MGRPGEGMAAGSQGGAGGAQGGGGAVGGKHPCAMQLQTGKRKRSHEPLGMIPNLQALQANPRIDAVWLYLSTPDLAARQRQRLREVESTVNKRLTWAAQQVGGPWGLQKHGWILPCRARRQASRAPWREPAWMSPDWHADRRPGTWVWAWHDGMPLTAGLPPWWTAGGQGSKARCV
jgi:hypothetical protein